ncbi:MAG: imidazole glycerol phosphate synthase subunit HisH, partial [Duncaniella sp.]|nr:imidazole glycerol phosphate synthase subunit HisH [Duncaniella sp.]
MIAIIDYKMGNIRSVENALHRLNAEWVLTSDHDEIRRASHVLLPGVGNDAEAIAILRNLK